MATAIAVSFPLGEYHATPWGSAVNSAESEWPMTPWRIVRAILATWHTRCPEIAPDRIERIVRALCAEAPLYRLPGFQPSQTRHYLPGVEHMSGERGGTTYTLAPRLQIAATDEAVVMWPGADLEADDRAVLAKIADLMPYLGRAESICVARLLAPDELPDVDDSWTVPHQSGRLRVLTPEPAVTMAQLEITPDAMRKAKRLEPAGARWQKYRTGIEPEPQRQTRAFSTPSAVRWAVVDPAPMLQRDGILAASGLRSAVLRAIGKSALAACPRSWALDGHPEQGVPNHQHAHWMWLDDSGPRGRITELALWVPSGVPSELLGGVLRTTHMGVFAEAPKGYRAGELHLQSVGADVDVLPELTGPARRWRSRTPMLTDRHYKARDTPDGFIRREVERELEFRGLPQLVTTRIVADWNGIRDEGATSPEPGRDRPGRIVDYRRYRWKESMAQRRNGFTLELELSEPIMGPLALGALSHFGFGLFSPIRSLR